MFIRFVAIHAFDRLTDGWTDRRTNSFLIASHVCMSCSAVKTSGHLLRILPILGVKRR